MKKRVLILLWLLGGGAFLTAAYNLAYPWHEYRYRLTVEMNFDGQVVRKSEVYDIRHSWSPLYKMGTLGFRYSRHEVRGEAILFEIDGASPVIITMAGISGGKNPSNIIRLAEEMLDVYWDSPVLQESMKEGVRKVVPKSKLPFMVTFVDVRDPQSIRMLSPEEKHEVAPGRFVKVENAWIDMTLDYPDAFTIAQHLPWITAYEEWRPITTLPEIGYDVMVRYFIAKEFVDAIR